MFCKKGVLRNFANFTGKHLCQSLFFSKVATLLKKRLWHRCFPVNFAKFLRTPFFTKHLQWLHGNTGHTGEKTICNDKVFVEKNQEASNQLNSWSFRKIVKSVFERVHFDV